MAKERIRQQPIQASIHRPADSKPMQHESARHTENSAPVDHQRIAALAYEFWEHRGRPIGSPQEDWYRAERELD